MIAYATFCLGAAMAAFNTSYTVRELRHAFDLAKPKLLFTTSAVYDRIVELLPSYPNLEKVITLDELPLEKKHSRFLFHEKFLQPVAVSTRACPVEIYEEKKLI